MNQKPSAGSDQHVSTFPRATDPLAELKQQLDAQDEQWKEVERALSELEPGQLLSVSSVWLGGLEEATERRQLGAAILPPGALRG